ncbi:MAG: NUDIX domain-containing protein [Thermoplasmataceae archaeon]
MIPQERASVGILLNGRNCLLVKRKEYPGDPWSGNVALPGGHSEPGETALETLVREVREEVNLQLSESQIHKQLVGFTPNSRPSLVVYPFVVLVQNFDGAAPGPEIDQIRIVDLDKRIESRYDGTQLPAFKFGDLVVWGLTYRILHYFIESEWDH